MEALGIAKLLQPDTEWTNESVILIDLSIKAHQYAREIKSVLGVSIKEDDSRIAIGQKFLRQTLGLAFASPIKRGAKGQQQRFYQSVEISSLRQEILEAWLERDIEEQKAKLASLVALQRRGSPEADQKKQGGREKGAGGQALFPAPFSPASCSSPVCIRPPAPLSHAPCLFVDPPATNSSETGVVSTSLSLDSDVEVGSTGNINTIPVLPTQSAAYQNKVSMSPLEQLVEALPYCETVEDFTCVVEDYSVEMVEEAIVFQDTQPRRRLLTLWLEQLEEKASLPELKIGSLLARMSGLTQGTVAVILQLIGKVLETSAPSNRKRAIASYLRGHQALISKPNDIDRER